MDKLLQRLQDAKQRRDDARSEFWDAQATMSRCEREYQDALGAWMAYQQRNAFSASERQEGK